jgi:DNA-binding transcriptional regulator YdaS (Cro superfamily)
VPADRCPVIERETGGAVRCEELRPDVDWAYLRNNDRAETDGRQSLEGNEP